MLRRDVTELGISDRQLLILARALATRPRLLVLDEPTSALSAAEAERLFALVERMRSEGIAVLYVSHRLGEIDTLADRLVVLRDGRLTRGPGQALRLGQRPACHARPGPGDDHRPAAAHRRTRRGRPLPRGVPFLAGRPQDLDLRAGEVTGVVGLLGAGKTELARGLFSATNPSPGEASSWTASPTSRAARPTPSTPASTWSRRTGTRTRWSPAGRWPRTSPCRSSGRSPRWDS